MIRLVPPKGVKPLTHEVTWGERVRERITESALRLLNTIGVPGMICPMTYDDALTGYRIEVRRGLRYTILSVNGRDFYFDRLTGRLDGTGQAL